MKKLFLILLTILLAGCLKNTENDVNVEELKLSKEFNQSNKPPEELKLTSTLYELSKAPDTEKFAKEHNIYFSKGLVRVYILFNPGSSISEREEIIKKYNITVEKKAENLSRALVPAKQLIPMSKEPVIDFIKLSDKLIELRRKSHG